MNYSNNQIRRQDRLLPQVQAEDLLKCGEYGILSMVTKEHEAYGIPINYAWDGSNRIYFHCATEGKKIEIINASPKVSFCIVGATEVMPDKFTTRYESIIAIGIINQVSSTEEKTLAINLILDKYSKHHKTTGEKYAQKSFNQTTIICIEIESISGKCKK